MPINPTEIEPGKLYATKEAADFLKVNEQTIRRWIKTGEIRGKKVGSRWIIQGAELRKRVE